MKAAFIFIFVSVFLLNTAMPVSAQGPSSQLGKSIEKKVKEILKENNIGNENEDEDIEITPSVTPSVTPSESSTPSVTPIVEVTIPVPSIVIPNVGGEEREKEERKRREDDEKQRHEKKVKESVVIPEVTVQPAKKVIKNDEEEKNAPIAAVTKPIEPPNDLERGIVKGSFYDVNGLSQQLTINLVSLSVVLFIIGAFVLKGDIAYALFRKDRQSPLPSNESFTIPYIGSMHK